MDDGGSLHGCESQGDANGVCNYSDRCNGDMVVMMVDQSLLWNC